MFEAMEPSGLLAEIEESQRRESVLIARRLRAVAALLSHRTAEAEGTPSAGPGYALVTGFARASAEVGAALNMPPLTAGTMVGHAEALDTRLPAVATLLAEGKVDWRTVKLIITRSDLVADDLIAQLDQNLAGRITQWHCWSRRRVINAVDAAVRAIDPAAAKERRVTADNARDVSIVSQPNGMARLRGALPAPAASIVDKRLSEMATSICRHDTRTIAQRRADALLALSEGRPLACNCDRADCPVRGTGATPGHVQIVINVIASLETVVGDSDQPGYLEGYGVIDAEQVRQLAETAAVRLLSEPVDDPTSAHRYQPAAAAERWIRSRDLTCCFPGCDRSAWIADIDHTRPFNHAAPATGGPTAVWNMKSLCRQHHRVKTFLGGSGGWRDEQCADGTVLWTSPTGRTYRVTPAGMDLFPQLRPACAEPKPRKRSRRHERAARRSAALNKLAALRPVNEEQRRINRGRREHLDTVKWRNDMRRMLLLLSGGPSTSPWCSWVNEPAEAEHIDADWIPLRPSEAPTVDDGPPPF